MTDSASRVRVAWATIVASLVPASLFASFLLGACGGHIGHVDRLDQTLTYFHTHLLQAGEVQRAAAYVDAGFMEDFLALHDPEMNSYTLVDFTILSVRYIKNADGKDDAAVAVVKQSVIRNNSITVERRQVRQRWELRGSKWTLVSEEVLSGNHMGASGELGDDGDQGDYDSVDDRESGY